MTNETILNTLAKPEKRFLASIIDATIVILFLLPFMVLIQESYSDVDQVNQFLLFAFLYKVVIYSIIDIVIPFFTKGQTIGRMILKIRIFNEDGSPISMVRLVRRASIFVFIAFLSDLLFLEMLSNIIWMIVFVVSIIYIYNDPLRQTVHDKLAKTTMLDDTLLEKQK